MTDTRTIGVDYTFIAGQFNLASSFTGDDPTPEERFQGAASGTYMFLFTLPKTIAVGLYYVGDALSTIKN
jgi:hypothetical protein